jgi:hypothetical protein
MENIMSNQEKVRLCGHCGREIHGSESGLRHFGFYVAHAESRCRDILKAEIDQLNALVKQLCDINHDHIVGMQAAYIEWQHGKGAESAMSWIEGALDGPGLIPDESAPYGAEAQAYFDANNAHPFPVCDCGRPSNIGWMGKGFCCDEHYQKAVSESSASPIEPGKE